MTVEGNDLYWSKLKENAIIPTKSVENAGYDIYPCFEEDYLIIESVETKLIPTGIASAMSNDYYMQIQDRGSTGSKGIKYGAGVIDSGYRGEWFVPITNCTKKTLVITDLDLEQVKKLMFGDNNALFLFSSLLDDRSIMLYPKSKAIAQAVVIPVPKMNSKEVSYETLQRFTSNRGKGKLGSSNK